MKLYAKITFIVILFFLSMNRVSAARNGMITLRVAGDENYPPYELLEPSGEYKGFNVDIIRAVAIDRGIDLELIPMKWEDAMAALENGEVDAIQGMTISPSRSEIYDFTDQIVQNSQNIFVRTENAYVSYLGDLKYKRIAIQSGDVAEGLIKSITGVEIVELSDQMGALNKLIKGDVDAYVGNRLTGMFNIQRYEYQDKIKIVGDPLYSTQYAMAVKKGDTDTLNLLNAGLKSIKASGTYDKIYSKWFGESITNTPSILRNLLLASTLAFSLLSLAYMSKNSWNKMLKHEVQRQTHELDRSNQFKEKVIENMVDGIVVTDEDFKVVKSNPLAEELLGVPIYPRDDFREVITRRIDSELIEATAFGTAKKSIDYKKRDGDSRFLDISLVPLSNSGSITGYFLTLHDRTEEIKLYDIAKHNDKMKALGLLSAGLAHELRNPLTSIKAFVDLIPFKIDDMGFRSEFMTIVPKELNRLNDLISSLLDYSKPQKTKPGIVSVLKLLQDIKTLLRQKLGAKDILLSLPNEDITLYIDENQLKQVLLNICINSIDAIEKCGHITVSFRDEDSKVFISIADDGSGISEENLAKLFDPFFSMKKKGYGIGLSITERLVRENGGEISIESKLGKGTTVELAFNQSEFKEVK